MTSTPTLPTTPTNGLDRCECGCKYWTQRAGLEKPGEWFCFDCGDRFDPKDVHTEHCCSDHGCCYNDSDCTVVTGEKPQSYPCELCTFVAEQVAEYLPACSDEQLQDEVWRRRHATHGHVCDTAEPNCGYMPCIGHRTEIFLT